MTPDDAKAPKLPAMDFSSLPRVEDVEIPELYPSNLSSQLPEEVVQAYEDRCWAREDPEIERLYDGKIIAVHKRRVIAVGDNWKAVLEEGERVSGLPGNLFAVLAVPTSFFGCH